MSTKVASPVRLFFLAYSLLNRKSGKLESCIKRELHITTTY